MLRRIVDISLTVEPIALKQWTYPPPFPEIEQSGPERSRQNIFGLCGALPYHLGGYQDEVMMDLFLGHSQPHTHVESFLHDWSTMFAELPANKRFSRRDISQVPAGEFVGEASVLDFSEMELGREITLEQFKEVGKHIQWGDRVLVRTGFRERHPEAYQDDQHFKEAPGITAEAAMWLIEEKGIVLFATDAVLEADTTEGFLGIHNLFYTNGVLMMDYSVGLEQLSQKRVYLNTGVVFRHRYSEESPARAVAIEMDGPDLSKGRLVDLWSPMKINFGTPPHRPPPLFPRQEPYELKGELMKKFRLRPVQVSLFNLGEDSPLGREYNVRGMRDWHPYKVLTNRLGTHIEVPYMDIAGEVIPTDVFIDLDKLPAERLCGPAAIINLTDVGPGQRITKSYLERAGKQIREGDIVVCRTDFTDNYYMRPDWLKYSPGFTSAALEWLVDKDIKLLVTDTASVEEPTGQGPSPVKCGAAILFKAGVPVVTCAANTWCLQKERAYVFVSPLTMERLNAAPARVIVVEDWI